jgi:hypothetical protein
MPSPYHSSRFYHPHNIGWGVQIMKLLIMKFSPLPCYLYSFLTSLLDWDKKDIQRPDCLTIGKVSKYSLTTGLGGRSSQDGNFIGKKKLLVLPWWLINQYGGYIRTDW